MTRHSIGLSCIMLFAIGLWPSLGQATTITLGAGKVSTIFENEPGNSVGRGPIAYVGGDASGSPRRAMMAFNIAANLPQGAQVTDAKLTMYVADVAGSGAARDAAARTIELHRITNDWAHGPTGLEATPTMVTDQGLPAIPPSPTWGERRFQQNMPWNKAGGDFNPTPSASAVAGETVNTPVTWGSSPGLVADIQNMLNEPSSDEGWALVSKDENGKNTYRVFYTKDWTDTAMRPRLEISYLVAPVPLPAAAWLFGTGLFALAGAARRTMKRER